MSTALYMLGLLAVGVLLGLFALVMHVVMIVQGFKTSSRWGALCLLVPMASLVFAFARFGRRGWAVAFLVAAIGTPAIFGAAGYRYFEQTRRAEAAAEKTAGAGFEDFEKQTEDLSNLEDLQLDLE
ncbi:MAG: hypothetical protein R6V85_13965 [Polyangia bacterium]